jgi:hypothetical protein
LPGTSTPRLVILWEWSQDQPFVARVLAAAGARGLAARAVGKPEMAAYLQELSTADTVPAVVLDRASDTVPEAAAIVILVRRRRGVVVNDPDRTRAAADKIHMHLALMSVGVRVPWTLLLPPLDLDPEVVPLPLDRLGTPFVVKPAHGGGGEGVVLQATTPQDVAKARALQPDDGHLVQEHIEPADFAGHPAWFRILFVLGETHIHFWHQQTSHYRTLDTEEARTPWAAELRRVTLLIAQVSGMSLFSTELAMTAAGHVVAVDYVNDMCDLRLGSATPDGVPDAVVAAVAERIVAMAAQVRS